MIDIGKILKRAWHILWNYRILWIFGILLAITSGGSGGGNSGSGGSSGSNYNANGNANPGINWNSSPFLRSLYTWFQQNIEPLILHPAQYIATFVWIGIALLLLFIVIGVVMALVRYPTETAVIRMVNEYEATGQKVGFRQGWKLGWNRRAFRIWVIDLIVSIPGFLLLAVLGGLAFLAYLGVRGGTGAALAGSLITTIGCAFLFILAFIVFAVMLSLLRQFFTRFVALEDAGIGEAFRKGWNMFKRNWKSAGLMWLVMVGLGIGFGIAGVIVFFLLIPTYIVLAIPAVIVAIIPGLAVFGITSIFASGPLAWILGVLAALPFFFLIAFAPLSVISGWFKIFDSSVWTLTFREIQALENVAAPAEVLPPLAK
ncbi:MAG TPA: hypothetical protein VMT91_08700 [Anaerolineales bacterium]|nr:hypothetical protein [Anaerolineales bacterium]